MESSEEIHHNLVTLEDKEKLIWPGLTASGGLFADHIRFSL